LWCTRSGHEGFRGVRRELGVYRCQHCRYLNASWHQLRIYPTQGWNGLSVPPSGCKVLSEANSLWTPFRSLLYAPVGSVGNEAESVDEDETSSEEL